MNGQGPISSPSKLIVKTSLLRFEMERSQWEVEKAELQARIAFLQGERKGQENLKRRLSGLFINNISFKNLAMRGIVPTPVC